MGRAYKEVETINLVDITGQRFGRWTVVKRVYNKPGFEAKWLVLCDCGTTRELPGTPLRAGYSRSCGCLSADLSAIRETTHGMSNERLYAVWNAMINRCYKENHKEYHRYGGRGITVCDQWRNNYLSFREWAIANGYDENAPRGQCTIDRVDNDKGYSPDNCRWVDMKLQAENRGHKGGCYGQE